MGDVLWPNVAAPFSFTEKRDVDWKHYAQLTFKTFSVFMETGDCVEPLPPPRVGGSG